MKHIYCFLLILCPYLSGSAQSSNIKPLVIGDKVPDIQFTQMVNSKSQTITLSQFKGKLVILDFWATWCGNCFKKIPLLDSMQRKYPGKLQIILISTAGTKDTKEKLEKFFIRQKNLVSGSLILPAAYNDTLAIKYFPHTLMPHYVWISPAGQYISSTGPDELNARNIEALINGNTPAFAGLSLMQAFDFKKPLFINNNGGNGEGIRFRSTLGAYIPGMIASARYHRDTNGLTTGYTIINTGLLNMVKLAYRTDMADSNIKVPQNGSLFNQLFPQTDSAVIVNSFTYELITPPVPHKTALHYIRQDLERFFGISAKFQNEYLIIYQSPKQ